MPPRFLCQERKGGRGQQENRAKHEAGRVGPGEEKGSSLSSSLHGCRALSESISRDTRAPRGDGKKKPFFHLCFLDTSVPSWVQPNTFPQAEHLGWVPQ